MTAPSSFLATVGNTESYSNVASASDVERQPRRFKTAFIFFSSARHKEIKEELARQGKTEKTTTIAKALSKEWREMKPEDREFWEDKSRQDRDRYEAEMTIFKQSQKLQSSSGNGLRKSKKDPNAPKRPMSAFLAYSNQRRAALKRQNPDATNSDLSKMLSITWKELAPEMKAEFVEEEARLRAQYKLNVLEWRKKKSSDARAHGNKKSQAAQEQSQPSIPVVNHVHQEPRSAPVTNSPIPRPPLMHGQHTTGISPQRPASFQQSSAMHSHIAQHQMQYPSAFTGYGGYHTSMESTAPMFAGGGGSQGQSFPHSSQQHHAQQMFGPGHGFPDQASVQQNFHNTNGGLVFHPNGAYMTGAQGLQMVQSSMQHNESPLEVDFLQGSNDIVYSSYNNHLHY